MAMPYEERFALPQPWREVFDAAQRCCDRMASAVMVSADHSTGRVVVVIRSRATVGGAVLLVDVGARPEGGSVLRIGAMSAFTYDFRVLLRFHVSRYRKALREELTTTREAASTP